MDQPYTQPAGVQGGYQEIFADDDIPDDDIPEDEVYMRENPPGPVLRKLTWPHINFDQHEYEFFLQLSSASQSENEESPNAKKEIQSPEKDDIFRGANLLMHLKNHPTLSSQDLQFNNTRVNNTNVYLRGPNYKKAFKLIIDEVMKTNIIDNGADTSVIGQGWLVIAESNRKVNVIGFDETSAMKKD